MAYSSMHSSILLIFPFFLPAISFSEKGFFNW